MSTVTFTDEIEMSACALILSLTPVGLASGIFKAGEDVSANLYSATPPPFRPIPSATASAASMRPCPNQGLQVTSGAPMLVKAGASNGAIGEMSHPGLVSKFPGGVRGSPSELTSFEAV